MIVVLMKAALSVIYALVGGFFIGGAIDGFKKSNYYVFGFDITMSIIMVANIIEVILLK